jgi:hypothetical protein
MIKIATAAFRPQLQSDHLESRVDNEGVNDGDC